MIILSEKLALTLKKYDEFELSIRRNIDDYESPPLKHFRKGNLRFFRIEDWYLCIDDALYEDSLLKSVYGNHIDRTNENSFDTELYFFFIYLKSYHKDMTLENLKIYIKGMEIYAETHNFKTLWHLIIQGATALEASYDSTYTQLLTFFAIIEALILDNDRDEKKESLGFESARKLPFFAEYNSINIGYKSSINKNMSIETIFQNIVIMRHKVIHGDLGAATKVLDELFDKPESRTEDAESSAFQDQLKDLNNYIARILTNIIIKWLENPKKFQEIKSNLSIKSKGIQDKLL